MDSPITITVNVSPALAFALTAAMALFGWLAAEVIHQLRRIANATERAESLDTEGFLDVFDRSEGQR